MAAMDEPCLGRSNTLGKTDSFVKGLMGVVWQWTQGIGGDIGAGRGRAGYAASGASE